MTEEKSGIAKIVETLLTDPDSPERQDDSPPQTIENEDADDAESR